MTAGRAGSVLVLVTSLCTCDIAVAPAESRVVPPCDAGGAVGLLPSAPMAQAALTLAIQAVADLPPAMLSALPATSRLALNASAAVVADALGVPAAQARASVAAHARDSNTLKDNAAAPSERVQSALFERGWDIGTLLLY